MTTETETKLKEVETQAEAPSESMETVAPTDVAEQAAAPAAETTPSKKEGASAAPERSPRGAGKKRPQRRNARGGRSPRPKSEFDQKIVDIRRVTRVMAGGRRFSFSVAIVVGDRKGRVGVGVGKASDTALAIEKAVRKARTNMITVKRTKTNSLPHEVDAKYCGSIIMMLPAPGKGLVAGSSVRTVLDLGGITDVSAKLLSRSKNKLNNAHAALAALKKL